MLTALFDRITRASVRFYPATLLLALVISVLGVLALGDLNLELLPRIEFPQTVVVVQWPEAESAEAFAETVTIPFEEALSAVDGVVNVESTTSAQFAFIVVRNDFGLDQEAILADIRAASDSVGLPAGVEPPQILNFSLSDLPVVIASVSSPDLSLPELKAVVQDELQPMLEGQEQVSRVTVSGGQELPEELVADEAPAGDEEEVAEAPTPEPEATPTAEPSPTAEPTATPDPARLPEPFIQGMASAGLDIETADQLTPEMMQQLAGFGDIALQALALLTPDNLRAMPPETIASLPPAYVETLDPDLREELDELAAEFGGAGALVAETEEPAGDETPTDLPPGLQVEPQPLPESWIAAGQGFGQPITTTADITVEAAGGILQFAPELLADLEPPMWRALDPAVLALLLPEVGDTLDPELQAQLPAIVAAAAGEPPEPVALPPSWIGAAAANGVAITTTADLTPELVGGVATLAPELLGDLTPDMLMVLQPEVLAALPPEYLASLDEGLQQTLQVLAVRRAQALATAGDEEAAVEEEEETAATPEPTATPDPGRLPDVIVQMSASAGQPIEYAQDITPEMMRLLSGIPQATQFLGLLTPDNLRLLPAESIALLPPDFVETLDADLRAELDELAAEFGGAGALAAQEAAEAEALPEAPPLSGPWLEPGPDGSDPIFLTAADLLNNPFGLGGAELLNFLPDAPIIENAPEYIAALTPEVLQYLAENEEGFVENLSPAILELMSPEALTFLLENYPEAFDEELTGRLQAIAAGEVAVFIPEASITRTNSDPSVILSAYKDGDANTVNVAHDIFETLDAFTAQQAEAGSTVNVALVFEQATFIEDSIEGVSREGILGAVFAVLVILVFLSGRNREGRYKPAWRSTAVTAVSIPLSILAAFVLMRWIPPTLGEWIHGLADSSGNGLLTYIARLFPTSVTLNIMTLSGLTVAVGRVVDDSIVVLENIYRFIQKGDDPRQAVLAGTREVAIAIFASTATTVAVFLPLGLIGGLIGSFFLPFGLTVTYALAASFVVAITVVPALAFLLIRKEHLPEEQETTMQRAYTPTLVWALRHRGLTLLLALLLFAGSLWLLGRLPTSFIPELGEPTVNVSIQLPAGTNIIDTNAAVAALEAELETLDGIRTIQTEVGSGGGIEAAFFGSGGVTQNLANLTITPAEISNVTTLTQAVRDRAEDQFGAENVTVSAASQTGFGGFGLVVTGESLDELRAVAPDVKAALSAIDADGNGRPDITNVTSSADTAGIAGESTIIRVDGRPAISFSGELETDNTLGVTTEARERVIALDSLPAGAEVTEGFESEQQVEGFRSMVVAIGYSIILVYIIMALTFRSLLHPFTILFSLPFALVGAALALFLTNSVLGISAMIGLMMLVGIVVTNAIVLMELLQQLRAQGMPAFEALVAAGRTRLRPIWMTALTAVLALIPLAVSSESGAVIASELARVVIGGLLVSTALTLIVVPVVYSLLDQLGERLRKRPAG